MRWPCWGIAWPRRPQSRRSQHRVPSKHTTNTQGSVAAAAGADALAPSTGLPGSFECASHFCACAVATSLGVAMVGSPTLSLTSQALAGLGIEEVYARVVSADAGADIARRHGHRKGDRCTGDIAVDEAGGTELLDKVFDETQLASLARPEAQVLGSNANFDGLAIPCHERARGEAD